MNAALPGVFDAGHGNRVDIVDKFIQIVDRQAVESYHAQIAGDFLVAVDVQREAASKVFLGFFQLFFAGAIGDEILQHPDRDGLRLIQLVVPGLQADFEGTLTAHGAETTVCGIGQTFLFAHFL